MKKKIIIFIILVLLMTLGLILTSSKPQKVLLVGEVIGFEVEGDYQKEGKAKEVKASTQKIGTVTFMKKDTYEFVALGHSTLKVESANRKKSLIKGTCYDVNLEGIEKGSSNQVGGINASLITGKEIGNIYYDSSYGIFGEMNNIKEEYKEVETKCWYNVRRGKAEILADLDGYGIKSYDIEIIGLNYINGNKNIKVKITDKELIAKTGGIIQGMSGTPIMQER